MTAALLDPRPTSHYDGDELIDDVAVDQALAGRRVRLTPAEEFEVVRRGSAAGLSSTAIADLLGFQPRHVQRMRAGHR